MKFCEDHFASLRPESSGAELTPERVSELVREHVAFDAVPEGACPVCVSVETASQRVLDRWVWAVLQAVGEREEKR